MRIMDVLFVLHMVSAIFCISLNFISLLGAKWLVNKIEKNKKELMQKAMVVEKKNNKKQSDGVNLEINPFVVCVLAFVPLINLILIALFSFTIFTMIATNIGVSNTLKSA